MPRILLVEDDELMRITVYDRLVKQGWDVDAVVNGQEALERIEAHNYHLILTDIRMPGIDGLTLLDKVLHLSPHSDIILMTAYGCVEDAISCLKRGATDYVLKPFDMDDLIIRINRALELKAVKAKCASLEYWRQQLHQPIIGSSAAIQQVLTLINQVAPTDSTVFITGESGTGKELAAAAIHQASPRADKPYIRINCAAIPDGLMEAELFGHEKGAFTGAHAKKPGKFEMADGGTLLLDEIGDMPLELQAKLLRVLQEGECERVGGTRTIKVDVRILCSTAKDLEKAVREGTFRQDLYFRLRVIPITMPPLRERKEDIPLLVNHFLKEFSAKRGVFLELSAEAQRCLLAYDYPGNVRELKNIIERASVLAPEAVIRPQDLPPELCQKKMGEKCVPVVPLASALAKTEKECVLNALAATGGNRTKAAQLLGISRKNLWEKMKLHNIALD